ncbi:hypothetical protein ACER0C_023465 [Sarotherodon galilaeus]
MNLLVMEETHPEWLTECRTVLVVPTHRMITEMFGYKINNHNKQYSQWRRRLETKIEAVWREVNQLLKLQKEPGPDMIRTYKLRRRQCLMAQMNLLVMEKTHPEWLTQCRTVLVPTDRQKALVPSNYQPSTGQ